MATAVATTEFRPPAETAQCHRCSTINKLADWHIADGHGDDNFDKLIWGSWHLEQTAAANEDEELPPYEQELTSYLRESRLSLLTDIYAFCGLQPICMLDTCCAQVFVCRQWTVFQCGRATDRCSNLNGNNAEKLLFLAYNIRLFGFNY